MVVYWGMLIWVFILGFLQPEENNPLLSNNAKPYQAKWGNAIALMFPVTFFAMMRCAPIDTTTYMRLFEEIPKDMSVFRDWIDVKYTDSQLFYGLQMMFKCYISDDTTMWLATIALIEGLLVTYALRKHSVNIAISVYIFMASTMFTWMYNGIRQFLVVTILFALTSCIEKNRWYIYIPVVLICGGVAPICDVLGLEEPSWYLGGFHQSALMMIPVFFFVRGKAFNWKMMVFVAAFMILLMTGGLDSFLESATETTVYSQDLEYVAEDTGAHPLRAVVPAVPLVMALLKYKEIRESDDIPPLVPICINMSIVTVALYLASIFTSGLYVGRLPIYTEIYNLLLLPWLITGPYKRDQSVLTISLYGAYLMWFVYQMHLAWGGLSYASWELGLAFYGGTY